MTTKIALSQIDVSTANAGAVLTVQAGGQLAASTSTVAAAGGGGGSGVILLSNTTISENFDIPAGQNGLSIGPVTQLDGANVTIAPGQRWLIL